MKFLKKIKLLKFIVCGHIMSKFFKRLDRQKLKELKELIIFDKKV